MFTKISKNTTKTNRVRNPTDDDDDDDHEGVETYMRRKKTNDKSPSYKKRAM